MNIMRFLQLIARAREDKPRWDKGDWVDCCDYIAREVILERPHPERKYLEHSYQTFILRAVDARQRDGTAVSGG